MCDVCVVPSESLPIIVHVLLQRMPPVKPGELWPFVWLADYRHSGTGTVSRDLLHSSYLFSLGMCTGELKSNSDCVVVSRFDGFSAVIWSLSADGWCVCVCRWALAAAGLWLCSPQCLGRLDCCWWGLPWRRIIGCWWRRESYCSRTKLSMSRWHYIQASGECVS